jgi:ribosomal protein L29
MAKHYQAKGKTAEELVKFLDEKREELRKLRFEAAGARPKDTNAPQKVRKDIARAMTELRALTK